jgi:hypothetical protein
MRILSLLLVIFLVACNDSDAPASLLEQQPYKPLTDSIRTLPTADLYFRRGTMLYATEHREEGLADLRQAWQLQPREDIALALATALKEKHRDSAIAFLTAALQKLPGQPDAADRPCARLPAKRRYRFRTDRYRQHFKKIPAAGGCIDPESRTAQ